MSSSQNASRRGPVAADHPPEEADPEEPTDATPREHRNVRVPGPGDASDVSGLDGRQEPEPLGRDADRGEPASARGTALSPAPRVQALVRRLARSGWSKGVGWPLGAWAGLIAVAFGAGAVMRAAGALPVDAFPPLHASARLEIIPLLPAAALGLLGVTVLPIAARRLPWTLLTVVSWAASAVWAVSLQWPDGVSRPLTTPTEYLAGLPAMGDRPLAWLRGFTTHLQEYPTHVKGHPPLPMLILWILQWTGLGGAGWAAALVIAVGASSTAAIAITVRAVANERTARRALPFVILAPTALWVATSMDAVFLGIAAWTAALLCKASPRVRGEGPRPPWGAIPLLSSRAVDSGDKGFHRLWITRARRGSAPSGFVASAPAEAVPGKIQRSVAPEESAATSTSGAERRIQAELGRSAGGLVCAFFGGALAGSIPYLNYGLLSIFALPLAILILTRPRKALLIAFGTGCVVVPIAFVVGGFTWWDGVIQTHAAWAWGAGSRRPYAYFFVGDLAVLALAIGPAAATALPYLLRHATLSTPTGRLGIILGAVLVGVLALDISGVTRGEVERIWLPYAAWMTAGAALHGPRRRVLLTQVATALLIQALVKSPW